MSKINLKDPHFYILANAEQGIVARWTLASNRAACWALAVSLNTPKKVWLKQGWKCIPVKLEAA